MFEPSEEAHEKAYGKGVRDAQNAGLYEHVVHGIGDVASSVTPHWESSTSKSYEAGYHSGKKRRGGRNRSSYSGSSGSTERPSWTLRIIVLGAIVWATWNALPINRQDRYMRTQDQNLTNGQRVGKVSAVKSPQLNMRSGPGSEYSIVKVFDKGERIISIGEPENVNGSQWIRAATPDGQIEGWVNRKYIYP